jgi:DNA-binding NtrC family response regulator
MSDVKPNVLVVDDEVNILRTIGICLESINFKPNLFSKPQEALNTVWTEKYDLAFVDLRMSPIDGMEMLAEIKKLSPDTTVVIITAHGSVDSAVEAIKNGAYHYIQKPFDLKELQIFAQKAWEYHCLSKEVNELKKLVIPEIDTGSFITRNNKMRELLELAGKIAESNLSVLIEGESGTGKELIAHLIHDKSPRSEYPLVKVNCAALPAELLESELLGHIKGAFTGAVNDRQGRFELADKGTIFLDEIAEISASIQVKLLRVLQNKEFERIGESITRKVDVRIIAATNRNLDEALKNGSFREDLFYRLNAVRLKVTPIRERPEDIPILLQYLINKFGNANIGIAPEAMRALRAYHWKGNVREMENVIQRAMVLATQNQIRIENLPEELQQADPERSHPLSLEEMEVRHIRQILQQAKDYEEAAQLLGIDTATLWRKRRKYNL